MVGALIFCGALQAGVIEEKRPSLGPLQPPHLWVSPEERQPAEDIVAGDVATIDDSRESTMLSDQIALRLQRVELEGSSVLGADEVDRLTRTWIGRDITVSELHELRLALTEEYVNRGYVTSGVVIPDQTVEEGVLRVLAIENTISSIRLGEGTRINEHYVEHRLQRILAGPVNVGDLKNALRYLESDPMVSHVVARLEPGDRRGESNLDLDIVDQPRFAVELGVDNGRATSVGEERAKLGFSARNLSGDGDYVQLTRGFTRGIDEVSALVELPLSYFDLRGQMYYSSGEARIIEAQFKDLDIKSDSETFGLSFSQPVHRSERHLVTLSLGFEKKENRSELLDFPFSFSPGAIDGQSKVTTATLEASWTGRGDDYVVNADLAWRRGLDLLRPTLFRPRDRFDWLANPTGADGEFDVWLVQIGSVYRLNALPLFDDADDLVQVRFRMLLQRASEALMSFERVAIGGASTVRGFSENLFVRDNGLSASLELQVPLPGQFAPQGWRNILLLFFVDYGRGWDERNVEVLNPSRDSTRIAEIASAGMGFIWSPGANFRVSASWAHPIESGPDVDERKNSLQARGFNISAGWVLRF